MRGFLSPQWRCIAACCGGAFIAAISAASSDCKQVALEGEQECLVERADGSVRQDAAPLCRTLFDSWTITTPAEARRKLSAHRSQPVVLLGLPQAAGWDVKALSAEGLAAAFGAALVKVFTPAQGALLAGDSARRHSVTQLLESVEEAWKQQHLMAFDGDFFANATAQQKAPIPSWLTRFLGGDGKQMLSMGGKQSGTHFHAHGASLLTLLSGRKRWYLHEVGHFPNTSASAIHRGLAAWQEQVLPELPDSQAPMMCIQESGETLFIPDSWPHATENLQGKSIAVAWQQTTAVTDACNFGMDYMCLQQSFIAVPHYKNPTEQTKRYKALFQSVDEVTGGFPAGFLRFLAPYWQVSGSAESVYNRLRKKVLQLLRTSPEGGDDVVLAAALLKLLADAVVAARQDFAEASKLLHRAMQKAPESGLGVALAQLLAQQGRWTEAIASLEQHLRAFPDDSRARTMHAQALARVQTAGMAQAQGSRPGDKKVATT